MFLYKSIERLQPVCALAHGRLQRIADLLFMNAGLDYNPGLLNGKMGIAIFLYHYARSTRNEIYETYAGELIDEIYRGISTQTPVDFANGLTGIGWGIEYLVRNGFVEADTDEALQEIDNAIYNAWLKPPAMPENNYNLPGYGFYLHSRLQGKKNNDNYLTNLEKKQHLIRLINEYEMMLIHRRNTDYDILSMSTGTINSIAWFILEMHKLGIFREKAGNLLQHLLSEIKFNTQRSDDWTGDFIICNILQHIIPLITDTGLQQKYKSIAKLLLDKTMETNQDDESFVNSFAALAWQKLVYFPYIKEDTRLQHITRKAFKIIDDDENWDRRLDKLNKDNLGLTGLAGLGLGLMNYRMKQFENGRTEVKYSIAP